MLAVPNLPFSYCRQHGVLLQAVDQDLLLVFRPPLDADVVAEIRRVAKRPFSLKPLEPRDFDVELTASFQRDSSEVTLVAEGLGSDIDLARLAEEIPDTSDLMDADDDAPVIRLINALLSQAVRERASDIHVEIFEDYLVIRLRVDGVLREVLRPRRMFAPLLVSRLKVMAHLDISERRIPQDGRITVKVAGHSIDIRVSSIPSMHGERIVLRLLDRKEGLLELPRLGMADGIRTSFERALSTPHGIILITGPTGSGKTTTLYAGLSHINSPIRNIMTVEDPIEYQLSGIAQTQVNPRVDMSFARGLRAILRQDPDVVMVGEIRDVETARIAVQASLTGHLVLSTLHTNTAIGAITRLRDMGIESFLLSSSLIAVIAQRLVRLICSDCSTPYPPSMQECEALGMTAENIKVLYRGSGCKACNSTGYRGRTGIYELILLDERLQAMIHDGAPEHALVEEARNRWPGMLEDGRRRVLIGETTVEELLRVISLD